MRRHWPGFVLLLFCVMLALPAAAQGNGIRWQQDLEAAKMAARQSGRLVLVHFFTPSCGPCATLEQRVFNQPGVAAAIEPQFVPVKLDADANSATAQGFGITRVPTDVVITPDGQVVGKLVSPPTPSAYVAEVTRIAGQHRSTPGSPFDQAAAMAPTPPQLNAAYASLPVGANTPPVVAQPVAQPRTAQPFASPSLPAAGSVSMGRAAAAPQTANNQYAAPSANPYAQAPFAPSPNPGMNRPAARPVPSQVANSYVATRPTATPPMATQPAATQPAATPPAATPPAAPPLMPVTPAMPTQVAQQPPAAAAEAPVAAPDPKQLPPGAPPLGFDGYCPVSMRNHWKWVPGDPRWGIVHRGRTYWFAGQAEQQQFWSDPDRYSPALSGMDPVMAIDHQQQVPGKREHSIDYDNLFYMFCSEATLQQFTANPDRYAAGAREAMGIPRGRLVR